MKGLFDLSMFESMDDDDVLNLSITEGKEDTNIETEDLAKETKISIPGSTEITTNQWNKSLASLKSSFKEAIEVMEILENSVIVPNTVEGYQEDALDDAIYECYMNGPIYEAVKADNKEEIKEIVNNIKKRVAKFAKSNDIKFIIPNKIVSAIRAVGNPTGVQTSAMGGGDGPTRLVSNLIYTPNFWATRLWQIVGNIVIEGQNLPSFLKELNEEFKEDLGGFKLIAIKYNKNLADMFRTKFGWKNHLGVFGLIVDKKMPYELKALEKEDSGSAELKGKGKDDDSDKKDDKKDKKKDDKKDS